MPINNIGIAIHINCVGIVKSDVTRYVATGPYYKNTRLYWVASTINVNSRHFNFKNFK